RYLWPDVQTAPTYEFTTLVSRGTPGAAGIFEDKVELGVDIGTASPHEGNVYVCWARFTGGGNNAIELATSTDGGETFRIQRISDGVHGNQSCDVAVTKTGTVFVTWRQFEFAPGAPVPQKQRDAVMWVRSTDGGRTFTKPDEAFQFIHWDMTDRTLGGGAARDCGDGPLACQSGYVFGRVDSGPRNGADPVAGQGDEAYVVIEATVEGTEIPTGTTYGTVESGTGSQGAIFFSKTENGGASWSEPKRIDVTTVGHQFYADIDVDNGALYAVYHDSRNDNASGPSGGDFRTAPFGNVFVGGAAGAVAGIGLETRYSQSTDGGDTWSSFTASSETYLQNFEQFGNRDVPFFGDYNYVDVVGSKVLMNWTDSRDTVGGPDPRYDVPAVAPDNGTDGFDVHQCRVLGPMGFSADHCPNAGGLNQNIYGLVLG
ncbi:MAG: sialidase family protein, partial [Gaiellaceae bacterium]